MYEQPSIHLELAKQRHAIFAAEAERARLAASAPRRTPEVLVALKSLVDGVKSVLTRRPVDEHQRVLTATG